MNQIITIWKSNGSNPLKYLCGVEELNLSDNNFKTLPSDVDQLTNLRVLNLSNNPKFNDINSILKVQGSYFLEKISFQRRILKKFNNLMIPVGKVKKLAILKS